MSVVLPEICSAFEGVMLQKRITFDMISSAIIFFVSSFLGYMTMKIKVSRDFLKKSFEFYKTSLIR